MNSDSFFFIGKSHIVNQDYALHGTKLAAHRPDEEEVEVHYAIVCDGCSSSKDTDFGARILAKAAAQNISLCDGNRIVDESFASTVIEDARMITKVSGWNDFCLDATLMVAASTKEQTMVNVIGDGVVAVVDKSDNVYVYDVTYPSGAPRYLNYWHKPERIKTYNDRFGNKRVVNLFVNKKEYNITDNAQEETSPIWNIVFDNNDYKMVVLMSDGVHSFQEAVTGNGKTFSEVKLFDVLDEVLAFKGLKGEFVKRRIKRFSKKTNWENTDDVSVAAIYLEDE